MLTAIGDLMREAYARRWITTRDGNASLRKKNSGLLYITPSGWRKSIIHPEHMIRIKMSEAGLEIPKGASPSGELHMHHRLLEHSPSTRAVFHAHPTHIVAAMYRGFDLQKLAEQFPEIFRYTRVGPSVPPIPATSRELGDATAEYMGLGQGPGGKRGSLKFDIVGQSNHGVCAVGPDPWAAFEHVERLDHICEIVLKSGVTPDDVASRAALPAA